MSGASRRASAAAGLAAVALILSGCLSTGYSYVSHRIPDHTEMFFKVPSRWRFFTNQQVLLAHNPKISRSQLRTLEGSGWLESFTPNPHASAKSVSNFSTPYPMGEAYSRAIGYDEHQTYSVTSLRTEILSSDPLAGTSPDKVLSYSEFTGPAGLRGIRMLVDVPISNGRYVTLEQISEVDAATNWVDVLAVGCTVTCWRHYGGIVKQVMKSWSVRSDR